MPHLTWSQGLDELATSIERLRALDRTRSDVLQRVLGVCLDFAVPGAEGRHAPAAVGHERRAPGALVRVKEARQRAAPPAPAPATRRATRGRRGRASAAAARRDTATPARIAASFARRQPFEADLEEAAREQVHDDQHRHVGAAQRDARRRRSRGRRRCAARARSSSAMLTARPVGGGGEVARGDARAPGDRDEHQVQPVQRPAERQPRQRAVGAEVLRAPRAAAPSSARAAPPRTRRRPSRARSRWSRASTAAPPPRRSRSSRPAAATRTGSRAPPRTRRSRA